MHAAKGKDRYVLVFPALGIAVKLPLIQVVRAIQTMSHYAKNRAWKALRVSCFSWKPESHYVVSGFLFRGIVANKRERKLWSRTHNPFLQPTWFSLFGLVNIQQYGEPYKSARYIDLWDQIRRITNEDAYSNPHQFCEPDNYCMVGGKLRILDYGGQGSAFVVMKHGRKIVERFDPAYRWPH